VAGRNVDRFVVEVGGCSLFGTVAACKVGSVVDVSTAWMTGQIGRLVGRIGGGWMGLCTEWFGGGTVVLMLL
jgi:hypothetical protein